MVWLCTSEGKVFVSFNLCSLTRLGECFGWELGLWTVIWGTYFMEREGRFSILLRVSGFRCWFHTGGNAIEGFNLQ